MYRFFSPSENISDDKIIISDKKQFHHLRDVLWLKVNEEIVVFDEKGNHYDCVIEKIANTAVLSIKKKYSGVLVNKGPALSIACAIPKKCKMDDIVDKLTQLGVDRIIPLETQRVVVRWNNQKKLMHLKRWQKVALSSCQQCQRSILPVIDPVKDMKEFLSTIRYFDLKLIPTLLGQRQSLKGALSKTKLKNILVFIGPEGDFSPEEVDLAMQSGCIPVSLGDLVLRVDTAAIAVASFIRLYENY